MSGVVPVEPLNGTGTGGLSAAAPALAKPILGAAGLPAVAKVPSAVAGVPSATAGAGFAPNVGAAVVVAATEADFAPNVGVAVVVVATDVDFMLNAGAAVVVAPVDAAFPNAGAVVVVAPVDAFAPNADADGVVFAPNAPPRFSFRPFSVHGVRTSRKNPAVEVCVLKDLHLPPRHLSCQKTSVQVWQATAACTECELQAR